MALDPIKLSNRIAKMRDAYWMYLYRLPTQDEFDGFALSNGPGSDFTEDTVFSDNIKKIPNSDAAERAMRENGRKPNTTVKVPEGYGFGTSKDYDPIAQGRGNGQTQTNTQFFDADGTWIGGTNYRAYFESLFPGGTITKEELRAKAAELTLAGISIHTNTGGDVIKLPDGSLVDVIIGVGETNGRAWQPVKPGGGTDTQTTASTAETAAQRAARMAALGFGSDSFQPRAAGPMPDQPTLGDMMGPQGPIQDPGTYTPGAAYQAPEYRAPDPYQVATPFDRPEYQAATPFAAPTAADMGQDPGYQFRLSEGQKALERSGAARGVTNTGGNMKGLLDYGQQAASQEYGNVYNRNLNTYNTNEANRAGAYQTNYGNALNAYNMNEANRASGYNTNAANAFQQYSTNALANNAFNTETEARRSGAFGTNTTLYQKQQQDAYERTQTAYDQAMSRYQAEINNTRQRERDRMNDLQFAAGA